MSALTTIMLDKYMRHHQAALCMQALMSGSWRKAYDYLAALSSWNLMSRRDETLAMLRGKLQVRPC